MSRNEPAAENRGGFFLTPVERSEINAIAHAACCFRSDYEVLTVWGALTYSFPGDWTTSLGYRAADNDSTDDTFAYDRVQVTLGMLKAI
jgi:hypothetical protein